MNNVSEHVIIIAGCNVCNRSLRWKGIIASSGRNPEAVARLWKVTRHVPGGSKHQLLFPPKLYTMTDDDRYKLTCLVEGDKNAFLILISRDAYIDQLTELIYEKRKKGLFRDIDPADLTLLKVCKFLSPH